MPTTKTVKVDGKIHPASSYNTKDGELYLFDCTRLDMFDEPYLTFAKGAWKTVEVPE